jgi:hypothetical protein
VATSGPDGAKFGSEQEEADTKMIYHLSLLDKDVEATVVSPDTDVLVLLLRHFPKIPPNTCLQLGKTTFNVKLIHDKQTGTNKHSFKLSFSLPKYYP